MAHENHALTPSDDALPPRVLGREVVGNRLGRLPDDDLSARFNANELLRVIGRWKWLILGVFIGATLIAVLITLAMTPIYRATAMIEINPKAADFTGRSSEVQPQGGDDEQILRTQYGLLRSRALAERVVRSLNLGENAGFVSGSSPRARQAVAASKVASNLEVIPQPGSNLVQIAYSDEDAARSAQIANSISKSFIEANLERRYEATAFARRFLQTRLAAIRTKLEETERLLVGYAQREGIVELGARDPNGGAGDSLSAQSLTSINTALSAATADRITAEQRYRTALATGASEAVLDNSVVQGLRSQRAQLQTEYDQKLATFKPSLPDMISLKTRIDSIDRNIASLSRQVLSSLRSSYQEAQGREGQLRGQVGALRGNVLNLRGRGIQYNILMRDVDTNRALYDALLQRYKEIGVAGGVGESQASVVDTANRPGSPSAPNPLLNIAIGAGVGLILGLAIAFGIEFIDDTIKTPEDVLGKLNMPMLGLVPRLAKVTDFGEELLDQRSQLSEAYFSVVSSLQFSTSRGTPRSLLISSSRAAEGKTSTSLAVAQNLARSGVSVLLIDADLRKPSFTGKIAEGRGLAALLTGEQRLMDHVVGTYVDNLTLLPSGPIPPNPAELLSTGRIANVLREAGEHFDVVVVDGPPVLGLADSPILGSLCEATIMVVQAGSQRRAVLNSLRRLQEANAHLPGVVLTMFDAKVSGYGSSYGNAYGYGYGERYGEKSTRALIAMSGS